MIIGTFGAQLEFAEAQLFRQLSRSTLNRVILADSRQLVAFLNGSPQVRRLNRAYIVCPVQSPRAHHPKFILLAGPKAGRLLVGSGNLSVSGYAGPGECFTTYEWDGDDPTTAEPFAAIRDLLMGESDLGWLDTVTYDRLRDVFSSAPWIPRSTKRLPPVVHSLHRSLLAQLVERVNGRGVTEVVAAAPFHDKSGRAIAELLSSLRPDRLRLLVQDGLTRLDKASLARVLSKSGVQCEVVEAWPPPPYPKSLLHAKFILVRADGADVLLQGSANLSSVALCEAGEDANVEVSNLLEGEPGQFDDLLAGLDLVKRKDGLTTFTPDDKWGDGELEPEHLLGPRDVCWAPPILTGWVPTTIGPSLDVRASGATQAPTKVHWDDHDAGHRFALEFDEMSAGRIDHARHLELVDASGVSWQVFPYYLHSLLCLQASDNRADLLQEVGNLDLRDKELEELVAELDRVLVIDSRSLWRLAHPQEVILNDAAEAPHVEYGELDWESIGQLPQLKQYGTVAQRALLAPTELGIVLQSLTRRFRAEVGLGIEGVGEEDEADDLDVVQEIEDADELDDADDSHGDDESEGVARRLAPRQRVRRVWRNFVRRFVKGLSDAEFLAAVGSSVVVPSYIVFNHLCRRLRVVDLVDAAFLTESQIALWSFMWGTENQPGYLAGLPAAERKVAETLLADHDDLPLTVAALDDAWWHVYEEGLDVKPLRSTWRRFLESDGWMPTAGVLAKAAAVAMRCEGDESVLFDDLFELAAHAEDHERDREISHALAVPRSALRLRTDLVTRNGVKQNCTYLEVLGAELRLTAAESACAVWRAFEPDRTYFRIQSDNAVAIVDLDHKVSVFYDKRTGDEFVLHAETRPIPLWEQRLGALLSAA